MYAALTRMSATENEPRIAIVDVDYRGDGATAACVMADGWTAAVPGSEHTARIGEVAPYVPGHFFERELPCLLAVLVQLPRPPDLVIIDGYVWLGEEQPGLGARLHEALGGAIPVVGVAKTRFHGAPAVEVRRGTSLRPLFVTTVGIDVEEAARAVTAMAGEHRVPTLLARVDALARGR